MQTILERRRITVPHATALRRGVVLVTPILVFLIASSLLGPPLLATAGLLACLLAYAATAYPRTAVTLTLLLVIVIPIYWATELPVIRLGATPGTLLPLLLLPAVARRGRVLRWHMLDAAVAAFAALRGLSFVLNLEDPKFALVQLFTVVVAPYVVFRCLLHLDDLLQILARTVAAAGAALAVIGVYEWRGGLNPYFRVRVGGYQAGAWERPDIRFSTARAEASFGHPIPFGLFLLVATLLAIALAWRVGSVRGRIGWYAAATTSACGLLATLSRGPLAALALGLAIMLLTYGRRLGWGKAVGLVAIGAVLVATTPATAVVRQLVASLTDSSNEAASASYRLELARLIADPEYDTPFGAPITESTDVVVAVTSRTGLRSIDSEFTLVLLQSGLIPLGALALVGIGLAWCCYRSRRDDVLVFAWVLSATLTYLMLASVALLTQHTSLFWMFVGGAGGILARRGADEQGDPNAPTSV